MLSLLAGALANNSSPLIVLLLALRIGAVMLLTPVFSSSGVPVLIRVLVVFGMAFALSLGLPAAGSGTGTVYPGSVSLLSSPGLLIQAGCIELALGATLAVAIHLAFSAFSIAGRLLDIQIGFGLGQVFNPASNANEPIITAAFTQLAVVVFFLVDGHHALLRGLAYSLERFPLDRAWPIEGALWPIARQVAGLFGLAFSLAAPVVFCILMAEFALGVLARNLPQMNMLSMGIPIKIVVGLIALAFWLGGVGGVMNRVYGSIYQTWDGLFSLDPGPGAPAARPR